MKDLTGQRFGRLTAIEATKERSGSSIIWVCRHDCGDLILVPASKLISASKKRKRHGMSHTPVWNSWKCMLQRCYNPSNPDYKHYGGRGIEVCDRWRHSFENFYEDMGKRPKGKTLDRINNNGNYELSNCRWATKVEQENNTRRQHWFIAYGPNGEVITAKNRSKFAKKHGLCNATISDHLCGPRRSKPIKGWRFKFIEDQELSL